MELRDLASQGSFLEPVRQFPGPHSHRVRKAAAEKTAALDARSVTSLVEKLLMDAARQAGHWPPDAAAKEDAQPKGGPKRLPSAEG